MGVIYVNDGFRKSELPVNLKKSAVKISGGSLAGLDVTVEEGEENLVIQSENTLIEEIVKNEILNFG